MEGGLLDVQLRCIWYSPLQQSQKARDFITMVYSSPRDFIGRSFAMDGNTIASGIVLFPLVPEGSGCLSRTLLGYGRGTYLRGDFRILHILHLHGVLVFLFTQFLISCAYLGTNSHPG